MLNCIHLLVNNNMLICLFLRKGRKGKEKCKCVKNDVYISALPPRLLILFTLAKKTWENVKNQLNLG